MNMLLDYILIGALTVMIIAVGIMYIYYRHLTRHEKEATAKSKNQINRLSIILQTGKLRLWTYSVPTRRYHDMSEEGEFSNEYNPIDFSQFYDHEDFEQMRKVIFDIREGKRKTQKLQLKGAPSEDGQQRHYEVTLSIVERDNEGHAKTLLGVQRDITDSLMRDYEVSQLLMRYHTVFNSALADMIFYDKNQCLNDINDKTCRTFNIHDRRELLNSKVLLKDNPMFNDIDFTHPVPIRTTSIISATTLENDNYRLEGSEQIGKTYYEAAINPVTNHNGQLEGIYISGRNVTEMVESFHRQQEGLKQLRGIHQNIQNYIRNINYALYVSDLRLVNYYPDEYTFEISNNVNQTQLCLSQLRCIRLATPRFRKTVSIALNRMDHKKTQPIEETIELVVHDKKGRPLWLMFNMIPVFDANGQVERYFGICRNMTEQIETERRLAIESQKAQETETLKQTFLTNMSYEIRTPLNTVVGFAELFESEHDPADDSIFVEEIKKSSAQLLDLVNDILFLSRIDANMIESNISETDFAVFFASYCQLGLINISPDVKPIIENDYEHLVVKIDYDNVSKIIQRTCIVSSFFTQQGTIRCKYEYWLGELIFIVEDTGVGIDTNNISTIFNRFGRTENEFLHGTGLDLPIIQALTQMLGGKIELQSEKGKGTSIRITIPCEALQIEKKRKVINE